jgi:nitrate reductase alpha subunit
MMKDGQDGSEIDPLLSLIENADDLIIVSFKESGGTKSFKRSLPVRYVETERGRIPVTTVFDLLMAQCGVNRGLPGEYPANYNDEMFPFSPAWQEAYTGVDRETVIQFAREWAITAEKTKGKCTIIIGSGVNHWYHANLTYRTGITALILCGCVGVNGGGLNHYTGQEKVVPVASWSTLAMASDWTKPPRLQNGPSFHYVHTDQWRYEKVHADQHPPGGPFSKEHTIDLQIDAVRRGWLPFYPQFNRSPVDLVLEAEKAGARTDQEIIRWVVDRLKDKKLRFAVEDPDAPENWPRVFFIWRGNTLLASAKGHEYFLKHYLGTHTNTIADEVARDSIREVDWKEPSPRGKMDLVVDINFRMDTSALYSDIILPAATWYEKEDLNTTDLHSFIHPFGAAVPPCWESKTDWEIFKAIAQKVSELSRIHFPQPFRDVVATPLLHDTIDEIAQPGVKDWHSGECDPVPGKTMPSLTVVERDYAHLFNHLISLGPKIKNEGMEEKGIRWRVEDLYDELLKNGHVHEWNGNRYPSLSDAVDAANVILHFAPETNGEVAYRGFKSLEEKVGLPLADLAEGYRGVHYDFPSLVQQPRRFLTSPCWSGITNGGRAYNAYAINLERLVPWRTITGRQSLYLDHEAYIAFGENLPTFKSKIDIQASGSLSKTVKQGKSILLNYLTPHGKWHFHTTYYDDLRMLTLSRGIEPFWLNDQDAEEINVKDNEWIEAYNDHGVVVTRAVVSARVPRGICIFYHAPERTISIPKSPLRNYRRAGGHNSMTRLHLKPVLMVGGYAQLCYRFNDYGPTATDRDTYVLVRRLEGEPRF